MKFEHLNESCPCKDMCSVCMYISILLQVRISQSLVNVCGAMFDR